MIHDIARELQTALEGLGCPLPVIDGPENTDSTTYARERVVFEHDADAGDKFDFPFSQSRNPSRRMTCQTGAKCTIYVQATDPAAPQWEHRDKAEHARDLVLVALETVLRTRKQAYQITGGKLIDPDDLAGSPTPGGAAYELRLWIGRAVEARTWTYAAQPEAALATGTMKSRTDVIVTGGTAPPQTSCGA